MATTIIPPLWLAGSFEADTPFATVVNPAEFYTVEGTDGVDDFQAKTPNIFKMVYQPAGITETEYLPLLEELKKIKGVILTLTSKNNPPVYVPSNYIKSFPLTDGVVYEHICFISNLGAVPPELKDKVNAALDHFDNYLKDMVGIDNPKTVIGVIQKRGYVPKEQADAWENTRLTKVKENPSDLIRLNEALRTVAAQAAYITELENDLKTKK
jgi:hypothetical protein